MISILTEALCRSRACVDLSMIMRVVEDRVVTEAKEGEGKPRGTAIDNPSR